MDTGPTSHTFTSQRLRLHYCDWGNPDAPPLILQHGGHDHSRSWDWIARALRDEWHVIAPDLRGHGDSAWSSDGAYSMPSFVYDLGQLVHQLQLTPVTIVAHSLGAMVSLRYAGVFPEAVRKLVAIEGLGLVTPQEAARETLAPAEALRHWVEKRRKLSSRLPRRYAAMDEAFERMRAANPYLSEEQARHLTLYGVNQNEDGSFSWKFDNYTRSTSPLDLTREELHQVWSSITCPVLLCYGTDSWAKNPETTGEAALFQDARLEVFERAGHWLHHDQTQRFIAVVRDFL